MIYLVAGNDFKKARTVFNKYVSIFKDKQPAAAVFEFAPEEFNQGQFEEVVLSETLFLNKHIVLARRLSENNEALNLVLGFKEQMAESSSVFLFYEADENNELIKKLNSLAKEFKIFNQTSIVKAEFNIFSLADALGVRDRQKLWVLYQTALRAGVLPEDVWWNFLWQIKTMIIVATSSDPQTTGFKPFVVNKAIKANRNFSLSELKELYRRLLKLLSTTFPKSEEFAFGLEKIILNV